MKLDFAALSATILASTMPASASQITANIFNNVVYTQSSNSAPTMSDGYFFNIGADIVSGNFTSASATYPGGSQALSGASPSFSYGSPLQGQTVSAAAFPFGSYTVTATGGDTATATVHYTQDLFTTAIPYLANFNSLNGLDPSKSLAVFYSAFAPNAGATEGFTFFTISDASNVAVFDAGFQSPSTTGSVIGADTLLPNTTYTFQLDFSDRLLEGQDADGNFLQQGFDVRTIGEFTTGAIAPVPEPSTWAMLVIGFAGLGFAGRMHARRRTIAI
jgi:hypothetical protein